jgi:hypothetical protein
VTPERGLPITLRLVAAPAEFTGLIGRWYLEATLGDRDGPDAGAPGCTRMFGRPLDNRAGIGDKARGGS